MKNRVEIKKIPLEAFITTLMDLYNNGIVYVNMMVEKGDHQDSIWIVEDDSPEKTTEDRIVNFEELG